MPGIDTLWRSHHGTLRRQRHAHRSFPGHRADRTERRGAGVRRVSDRRRSDRRDVVVVGHQRRTPPTLLNQPAGRAVNGGEALRPFVSGWSRAVLADAPRGAAPASADRPYSLLGLHGGDRPTVRRRYGKVTKKRLQPLKRLRHSCYGVETSEPGADRATPSHGYQGRPAMHTSRVDRGATARRPEQRPRRAVSRPSVFSAGDAIPSPSAV
jgi:hypothetical protein